MLSKSLFNSLTKIALGHHSFRISRYTFLTTEYDFESQKYSSWSDKCFSKLLISVLAGTCLLYVNQHSDIKDKFQLSALCATTSYSIEEVAKHKTKETGIWVTYQGKVYNITEFVDQHPGGDKIMMAAGGAVEPFWALYAVHKENEEVMKILKQYEIGTLIEDKRAGKTPDFDDPYRNDPERHPALVVVNAKPFNAETPAELMIDRFHTPNALFFVRNHLPVPIIDIKKFRLSVEGLGVADECIDLTISDIKQFCPITKLESTIMCAGNRRKDMSKYRPVKGLSWNQGAISTAQWTGIKLTDLFAHYGLTYEYLVSRGAKFIQFVGLDSDMTGARYGSSIPIEMALDPNCDVLLAYTMNGEELSLDHGYPLRVIMPGVIGARQVKWLTKIVVSDQESDSFWQQNDYKSFSPSADPNKLNYANEPPITEPNVQSAICIPRDGQKIKNEGSVTVKGYAWSGAGRGIIRVEVSQDGGESWLRATITNAREMPISSHINRQQWSWVFWEVEVPVSEHQTEVEILCNAVDSSQNTQPESYKGTWNVRGLMSNAWHRIKIELYEE